MKKSRRPLAAALAGVLIAGTIVAFDSDTALALDAGKCSEASGTMTCNVSGESLDFSGLPAMTMTVGNTYSAAGIFTSSDSPAVTVDAEVEITEVASGGSISGSGGNINGNIGGNGATIGFTIDFFDSSTGLAVLMNNLEVSVEDIDGPNQNERAEFTGISHYYLYEGGAKQLQPKYFDAGTSTFRDDPGTGLGDAETGSRTFYGDEASNDGATANNRKVSVKFTSVSSIGLRAFSEGSGGGIIFSFGDPSWSADPTEYAVGDGEYTITYNANGGGPSSALPDPTTARGAQDLPSGAGLSKAGVNISSWNTRADGTGQILNLSLENYNPRTDRELFAIYESVTVTFDANGGSGTSVTQDGSGDTALTLNSYTRDSYVFAGWNTASDGTGTPYADGATFPFSVDRTLFAQWAQAPAVPTNLGGSASTTDGSVDLTWTAPNNNGAAITSYSLQSRPKGGSTWSSATDSDGDTSDTSATVSGLDSCVAYEFRVAATNLAGTSSYSTSTTVTAFGTSSLTEFDASDFVLTGGLQDGKTTTRDPGEPEWSAVVRSDEIVLTEPEDWEFGAVWSGFRFDLADSFCVHAEIFLGAELNGTDSEGNTNVGADGLAFVLQPADTNQGTAGGGLGYQGIDPSIAVEFDTYKNGTETGGTFHGTTDHVGVMLNGDSDDHDDIVTSGAVDVGQLEDEKWRKVQIRFDADQKLLTVKLDKDSDGTFEAGETIVDENSHDIAGNFSASSGLAYWGFTASTGGVGNYQKLRNLSYSPASLSANTLPTATSPGAQTVAVGASKNVSVTIGDSGETTADQWRVSVSSGNSSFATASVTVASATSATVALTGVADGDTTVTLTAIDADGASVTTTFALRVGAGTPSSGGSSSDDDDKTPSAVVTPPVSPGGGVTRGLPAPPVGSGPATRPGVLTGPVITPGVPPGVPSGPVARFGGVPTPIETTSSGGGVEVRSGGVNLGLRPAGSGGVEQNPETNQPELRVPSGSSTRLSGGGLQPGSTVQVWLPGVLNRELGRVPVNADGGFDGEIALSNRVGEDPLPIGRRVMQVTGVDENGVQTVIEMPVNIAQSPPAPEPNRQVGALPDLAPSQSIATSAGIPTPVTVTPFAQQRSVSIDGGEWVLNLVVNDRDGEVSGSNNEAFIRLTQSSTSAVSGNGFQPSTVASVWMFSEPTLLGTVTVDDSGGFSLEFLVDAQFIAAGEHTLQVQGVGSDGYIKAANLGVLVEEPVELTAASASTMLWWVVGVFLLALVLLLFVLARRRRREA